ncbi:MAG TPA: DUF1501 domain-containing protein [Pirellulales bacterium]|jgi:hypothetical protein|nr:DUF1501 domain-containing protein [Pirellulales bacterium]
MTESRVGGDWLSRRDVLRVGSLALSACVWPGATKAATAKPTATSVIALTMLGGVTHIDSFDPKPDAPDEVRGTLGTIATRLPGVHFTEVMPRLAAIADRLALVRSFASGNNDHFMSQAYVLSGRPVPLSQIKTEPNVGSIVARVQGARNQLPGYIAVPGFTFPGPPPTNLFTAGWLGRTYDPFAVIPTPEEPDFTKGANLFNPASEVDEDLRPQALELPRDIDVDRLAQRSQLRKVLDDRLRSAETDGHYSSAFNLLASSQVRDAFDLGREPEGLRSAYGRTKIGGRCLLARRLVEAGARFVMVDYGYDPDYGNLWDNHNAVSQNHPHICEMAKRGYHLAGIDRAFAALITDLESRGLLESTLVVFLTEFGRTPKINARGGRDHWSNAGSIFFSGGGTKQGQVLGGTDKQGAFPTSRPYSPADVAATIYRALGIATDQRLYDLQHRPHFVLPHGEAIAGMLA